MMMNKIDNSGMGIASLGRDEDNYLAHVARGEMVVPPIISDDTRQRLYKEMMAVGLDPNEYTVGAGMSINPITGQPEFGFLKKIAKSVKKVVKKVAPIAAVVPGPWQPFAQTYQAIKNKDPFALVSSFSPSGSGFGKMFGNAGQAASAAGGSGVSGNIFSRIKEFVLPGEDKVGLFGNVRKGIGSLFTGREYDPTTGEGYDPTTGVGQSRLGYIEDIFKALTGDTGQTRTEELIAAGYSPEQIAEAKANGTFNQLVAQARAEGKVTGRGLIGGAGQIFGGAGDMVGNIFGGEGQGLGSLMGGNMGNALLAGLFGKAAYEASKERAGGLAETPLVTMDPLGRYQLSKALGTGGTREEFGLGPAPQALEFNMGGEARQYFNQGGLAMVKELDMRDGGESSGPGTGTSDDIPAMLSDGEFVMTAKAVRGAGSFTTKKTPKGIELIGGGKSSRAEGVKNMRELMNIFEAI
jgi:hypothetical protein